MLKRKAALAGLLAGAPSALQSIEHLPGDGARILEQACRLQVAATQGGQNVVAPPNSVAEHAAQQFEGFESKRQRPWAALKRRLDRESPDYAT